MRVNRESREHSEEARVNREIGKHSEEARENRESREHVNRDTCLNDLLPCYLTYLSVIMFYYNKTITYISKHASSILA